MGKKLEVKRRRPGGGRKRTSTLTRVTFALEPEFIDLVAQLSGRFSCTKADIIRASLRQLSVYGKL
jgi:hypothetical protein